MTVSSNEEYYPIENCRVSSAPYYLVSCRSDIKEFSCVAESNQDCVRFSFSTHLACRITNSSFRDYDMRNRFCKDQLYEIKNSQYLEQTCSQYKIQDSTTYHHYLISLDDTIVDVIATGDVTITLSSCLNETGTDISNDIKDVLWVDNVKPLMSQSMPYKNHDKAIFNGLQELSIPLVNFHENCESSVSNYGAVDLKIIINPLESSKEKCIVLFPEILGYKESSISQELLDTIYTKNDLPSSAIYEIQNSNFKEWLAYSGYRQLYGEPISLRHIRVVLHNRIYDAIIDAKEEQPYYVKDEKKYYF